MVSINRKEKITVGFILLMCCVLAVDSCSLIQGYKEWSLEKRLISATTVIYGKDVRHFNSTQLVMGFEGGMQPRVDVEFYVYCVLKGDSSVIPANITLQLLLPAMPCGVSADMEEGKEYIVMVSATQNMTDYVFDDQNRQGAAIEANHDKLDTALNTCGLLSPRAPKEAVSDTLSDSGEKCGEVLHSKYIRMDVACLSGVGGLTSWGVALLLGLFAVNQMTAWCFLEDCFYNR